MHKNVIVQVLHIAILEGIFSFFEIVSVLQRVSRRKILEFSIKTLECYKHIVQQLYYSYNNKFNMLQTILNKF